MILGMLFIVPVILMSLFPRNIRPLVPVTEDNGVPLVGIPNDVATASNSPVEHVVEKPSFKDMKSSLSRLIHNKIIIYSTLSYLARVFGSLPYDIYMVKHMEHLYNVASADAKLDTEILS